MSVSAALCALAGTAGAAEAARPPLAWQQAKKLQILCVLVSHDKDRIPLQAKLCEQVRTLAAANAALPVETIAIGDPAVLATDAVTLLVHASLRRGAGGRLLAFNLRPYRPSAEATDVLFGAAPRAVLLSDAPALGAAIEEALGETLPWRNTLGGSRPLN